MNYDTFDRIANYFQVAVSVLMILFSAFNAVRTVVQHSGTFYGLCFVAMLALSVWLFRLTTKEMREMREDEL